MDIDAIKITEKAYDDISLILNNNFGDIEFKKLKEETFYVFLATAIEAAYKVGYNDGVESLTNNL